MDVSILEGRVARGGEAYTHHKYLLIEVAVYFILHACVGRYSITFEDFILVLMDCATM